MAKKSVDMVKLGKRIKIVRIKLGLTQRQLSEGSNITEKYLSNIETGKANCSLNSIFNIANAMNTSLDYLLNEQLNYIKKSDNSNDFTTSTITHELKSLQENQKQYVLDTINLIKKHNLLGEIV